MSQAKPFEIDRQVVWRAWQLVRANRGAAGVDEVTIEQYERCLKGNLYRLWNRLSSGSYFPPPVRTVKIPKADGGERQLGIPTVDDRVAQMVAKLALEPDLEPHFHPDSYGYRQGKSAHDALEAARLRCRQYNWVLDLDIRGFFDNIDHELLMRAVRRHTRCRWILLYVERWLKAPALSHDGSLQARGKGTPQGGVISPLLANLFLHYALDEWLRRKYPQVPFERYADDMIVHCRTLEQAQVLRREIEERLAACNLELHPQKTKIVFCKDYKRRGSHEHEKFNFLGYEFRPRQLRSRTGHFFVGFSPAISPKAVKAIHQSMREWRVYRQSDQSLEDLAIKYNRYLRGWINYYGRFYRSALCKVFLPFQATLVRWAMRKYKRLRGHSLRAWRWLNGIARRQCTLFAHWPLFYSDKRPIDGSRMSREIHVRF